MVRRFVCCHEVTFLLPPLHDEEPPPVQVQEAQEVAGQVVRNVFDNEANKAEAVFLDMATHILFFPPPQIAGCQSFRRVLEPPPSFFSVVPLLLLGLSCAQTFCFRQVCKGF